MGWNRAVCVAGRSLQEFRELARTEPSQYSAEMSLQTMLRLGFLKRVQVRVFAVQAALKGVQTAQGVQFVPRTEAQVSYATLSVVWHLRDRIFEVPPL